MNLLTKFGNFILKTVETFLVIGFILFEELIWNVLAKPFYVFFRDLVAVEALKNAFLTMNRYLLLAVFIFTLALAEVLGFVSGFYFVRGSVAVAGSIYVLKIPLAAFTVWLFDLTKPRLLTFGWFKAAYERIMAWIQLIIDSNIHRYIKSRIDPLRARFKQWLGFAKASFWAKLKARYQGYKATH